MLATFVIGLREGLEAALIVGIVAAFLQRNAKPGAVKQMWVGVVIAILLCLAVGIGLQIISAGLPQRQQEMLECVVAAIAVVMVSYMILWMRRHSRGLKTDLERDAGSALAQGSAFALVAMAFLAVLREGLETAVFLLAAFQSSGSAVPASIGALLGIAVAVVLGWLIYRGGLRLNLSRFFRITGAVLVLVAAGLVAKTLRAAYEAGWMTIGQQHPLDLTAIARPGSVQASLLTGVLGITAQPALIEILGFLLYAVPMMLVVLWPPTRQLSRMATGRLLTGVGVAAAIIAVIFALTAPSVPTGGQVTVPVTVAVAQTLGTDGSVVPATTVDGTASVTLGGDGRLSISVTAGDVILSGTAAVTSAGTERVDGFSAVQYRSDPMTTRTDPATVPTAVTGDQLAELAGRLPIGLRAADADAAMPATFTDTARATIFLTPDGRQVVDVAVRVTRSVTVTTPTGLPVTVGSAGGAQVSATAEGRAALAAGVAARAGARRAAEIRGEVIPIMLGGFAFVMLAFGVPKLFRRRAAAPPAPRPDPPSVGPPDRDSVAADPLATAGSPARADAH